MRHHQKHCNAASPLWPCKLAIGSRQHAVSDRVFAVGNNKRKANSSRMIRRMHTVMVNSDLAPLIIG